jgi:hypothetical protein
MKNIIIILLILFVYGCQQPADTNSGLVGVLYNRADLSNPKQYSVIGTLEQSWGAENGFSSDWSGQWEGYVIAPVDGEITFYVTSNRYASLRISDAEVESADPEISDSLTITAQKGEKYPINLIYRHIDGGEGYFNVQWSYNGNGRISIPPENLMYDGKIHDTWLWLKEPDQDEINRSQFLTVPVEHVVVHHEPGFLHAWPANNGIWIWGDEILVGFVKATFLYDVLKHSFDRSQPSYSILARSLDGGYTWTVEDPDNFVGDGKRPVSLNRRIDFTHPDFALRVADAEFYYSYDRGKTWNGPYTFQSEDGTELTSRTDYLVNDTHDCLIFLSLKDERVKAGLPDRAFTVQTTDGGLKIDFVSWMTETDTIRSVMPSTVRIAGEHLVSALRRRYDPPNVEKSAPQHNWIDVYQSFDNGKNWEFLSKVADTDRGTRNGNPPSLVKLQDGRLCVTYAFRGVPYSIRARISSDNGKTWGKEIILRENVLPPDIGYTRSVVRTDGKVVTVYYLATEELKEEHIEATIWDPSDVISR